MHPPFGFQNCKTLKMNKLITIFCLAATVSLTAQHTFSIVAVDTLTGEVGSAGASCLDDNSFPGSGGAYIISDILPGRGAIHTQSYYLEQNQLNARQKMEEGLSPQQIIDWLVANDAQGNSSIRQYGIAAFDSSKKPSAAAHTGVSCLSYRNHRVGTIYSIQGNILKNKRVLDSMEAHFLEAQGTLADRLMWCLQGANLVGADSRCESNGTSSLSAFLRVAKPNDDANSIYLDLNVPSLPAKTEPIDSLQTLYDHWKLTDSPEPTAKFEVKIYPNPAAGEVIFQMEGAASGEARIFNLSGNLVFDKKLVEGRNVLQPDLKSGAYIAQIFSAGNVFLTRRLVWF